MRICPLSFRAAIRNDRTRYGQIGTTYALIVLSLAVSLAMSSTLCAQNVVMPPAEPVGGGGGDNGVAPMSSSGDVNFFSQDLGTILRLRYSTESYGQDGQGNFDVGSMQVITMDDSAVIGDGQVTMNDNNGVGFDVGVGYRWLNFPSYGGENGRVDGVAIWADGMHTEAGNFFPQIGFSYESLGEVWDMRGNLYVPLGPETKVGDFKATNEIGFQGNSLSQLSRAIVDTSFTVGELEISRRLGAERDAWAFAGPYFIANSDDSSGGARVGVRGYAFPDLLVQFALSQDDIFHTEAAFSIEWFVGRTRTNYQPAGTVADRIREPFMRNDYVALSKSFQESGTPLTQPNGDTLRFIHVASSAPAGGNGTFEHPYNELDQANGTGSQAGDIVFAHSTSVFNTNIILKNDQKLLGEGNNKILTVDTLQKGTIDIPESSPGARALARPTINIAANTDAVTLNFNNEVANFDMNGNSNPGTRAIVSPAAGAGNPNLHDLAISNTTGDAIFFRPTSFVDTQDINGNGNTTETIVPGNVTINNVMLTGVAGSGIHIDSVSPVDVTLPNTTLQETIAISNVTSTGGTGVNSIGLNLENTHTGHTTTLTNYTYDGGTTAAGGIRMNNFDGTFNASNSSLSGGSSTGSGVQILGDTDGNITFASTVTMNNLNGTAVDINGVGPDGFTDLLGGTINFNNLINNSTGRSISVQNVASGASVNFNGNVTDTGTGIVVNGNSGGDITFLGNLNMTIDTPGATAVLLTDNTGASIDFPGDVVIKSTGTANGFIATGGGTISGPSPNNTIATDTGQPLKITDMTVAAGGMSFGKLSRNVAGSTTSAIDLERNTGGPITIGNTTDTAGDAGTIAVGTVGGANSIQIVDSANATVSGLIVNNAAGVEGVHVEQSAASTKAMTVNLNGLTINDGTIGVNTIGGGTGAAAITMTVNDTNINKSTDHGMIFNNVDVTGGTGGIQINKVVVDGNNIAGTNGVLIENSNGQFTADTNTRIRNTAGTDFEVTGGTPNISFAGQIENASVLNAGDTSGQSVHIHNLTGGTVGFTADSKITDNNGGMLVENNGNATINFLGTNTFNTAANTNAITLNNNAVGGNSTITLAGLNVTANGTGSGLVATGGGTLNVTGTTNTITSHNGSGLVITDMTIGSGTADFESVTVGQGGGDTGPANAIILQNLAGNLISIGPGTGAVGAGGKLKSTGDAIVVQNVQSGMLSQIQITSAGTVAGDNGVEITHTSTATTAMDLTIDDLHVDSAFDKAINVTGASSNAFNLRLTGDTTTGSTLNNNVAVALTGSGKFAMLVDHVTVDSSANNDIAFSVTQAGSAQNADLTFQNGTQITAGNAQALFIDSSSANTAKVVNLLIQGTPGSSTAGTTFSNNSATAATADIELATAGTMNQTVRGTTFTNNGTGLNYSTSTANVTTMNLSLGGPNATDKNTASGGGATYQLTNAAGATFNVFDTTNTFNNTRNNGTVVPLPNAAAFTNTTTPPPTPTGP